MKIHPREKLVKEAERVLRDAVGRVYEMELTQWERIRIVNSVLSSSIADEAKFGIRYDRHGDTDTPGGRA